MAYNDLNVTAGKGDTVLGPLWWNPTPITTALDLDFDPTAVAGWVRLGHAMTEGVDNSQEADNSEVIVWGAKTIRVNYTGFKDTVVVRFASSTDPDVLKVVFGADNVSVTPEGAVKLIVKSRQPEIGTLLIMGVTDDGRKRWIVVHKAQADLNVSRTFSDEDIVSIETTFACLDAGEEAGAHYELTEALPA